MFCGAFRSMNNLMWAKMENEKSKIVLWETAGNAGKKTWQPGRPEEIHQSRKSWQVCNIIPGSLWAVVV